MSTFANFNWRCSLSNSIYTITPPTIKDGILYQMGGSVSPFGYAFPGHVNNGDFLKIDIISGNSVFYYNSSRVLIWNKIVSDISASHNYVIALYFSTIDDKYYVVTCYDALLALRLSSLDKTTGAVTNLSAEFYPFSSVPSITFGYSGITQLSSGNLLLLTSPPEQGLMIEFTNTGTIVSNTAITQSGLDMFSVNGKQMPITYRSDDGTILCGIGRYNNNDLFYVARGGQYKIIANDLNKVINSNLLVGWNGYVAEIPSYDNFLSSNAARFFIQSDFDRWLGEICTTFGI